MFRTEPLNQANAHVFTDYLSSIGFDHSPHWSSCYCRFYHTTCSKDEWQARTAEVNKAEALKAIEAGEMKGYLAFDKDLCIGWLNANHARTYARIKDMIDPIVEEKKMGGVMCFVIHSNYRRKGVASLLLDAAISGFEKDGYQAVLALPFDYPENPTMMYRGFKAMYTSRGFKTIQTHQEVSVMLKSLADE